MRKKTGMYLRKSQMDTELENVTKEETLARHKKILTELAEKMDLEIVEIYEEVVSGESIQDRPEMQRLLADVSKKRFDSVLVMEVQRLARGNTLDQGLVEEAFHYSGTKIITQQKTYDPTNEYDEEYFSFGLYMSRREYLAIKKRMSIGKMQSVKEGNYMGSLPPFGYDILKRSKRDRTLVLNNDSKYITQIYNWFIEDRFSCGEIARRLTAMGVPTLTRKSEWNRGTIKDILSNHLYYGKIRWNKRKTVKQLDPLTNQRIKTRPDCKEYLLFDGKHPAIITEERFNEAQALFPAAPSTKSRNLVNPFAGVIYCKNCGKAMVYQRYNDRPNVRKKLIHPAGLSCKVKALPYDDFLELIKSELLAQISDFTIKLDNYSIDSKKAEYEATKEVLESNLQKQKKKLNKLFDMFEEDIYTKDEFKERKEIVNNKIKDLTDEINSLVVPTCDEYEDKISTFSNLLETLSDNNVLVIHKNQLIKSIIKRIEYAHNNDIELDIYFNS